MTFFIQNPSGNSMVRGSDDGQTRHSIFCTDPDCEICGEEEQDASAEIFSCGKDMSDDREQHAETCRLAEMYR